MAEALVAPTPSQRLRNAVRELLLSRDAFTRLDVDTKRELAGGLVKICAAASAFDDERGAAATAAPTIAHAQSAGSEFSGVAAQKVADTTRQILNAVSFPRFVTELINGVFKAIVDTNQQQLTSYVDLIRNVAASIDGFADANVAVGGARGWLAERFPETFVIEGADDFDEPPADAEERAERAANQRLRLRPGATMPSPAALRVVLGLPDDQTAPTGDPESLVPLARMAMARNRQQMLATMVMLGLQRIVIDSGRLHASMRFHIDTRSAAQDDRASQLDARHSSTASGSFGYGPWGASATMTNTIGYVSTQKTQTSEEMNTDLNLDSSVELVFKTDYLPLERLAGGPQLERIKVNTLNPEAEAKAVSDARATRDKASRDAEVKRSDAITKAWAPAQAPPAAVKPGEPGSAEAADKARQDAAKKKAEEDVKAKKEKEARDAAARRATMAPNTTAGGAGSGSGSGASSGGGTTATGGSAASAPGGAGSTATVASVPAVAQALDAIDAAAPVQPDVVFVPSPPEVIDAMLALAAVRPNDLIYDLGCGDGRIVIAAAQRYRCRAVGIDIDPQRIEEARSRIAAAGVGQRVRVEQRDLFTVDLSGADVVTLYLLPQLNIKLIPQLKTLRPGARVVSHDFAIAGVIPDRVVQDYLPRLNLYKTYFLFTAPLRLQGGPVPHEWAESSRVQWRPSGLPVT
jgi:predicted O-methyltransferase YrrM